MFYLCFFLQVQFNNEAKFISYLNQTSIHTCFLLRRSLPCHLSPLDGLKIYCISIHVLLRYILILY